MRAAAKASMLLAIAASRLLFAEEPPSDPAAIAALVAALRSDDFDQRTAASERLRTLNVKALPALEPLLAAEKDTETRIQIAAAVEFLRFQVRADGTSIEQAWKLAIKAATSNRAVDAAAAVGLVRKACAVAPAGKESEETVEVRYLMKKVAEVPECSDAAIGAALATFIPGKPAKKVVGNEWMKVFPTDGLPRDATDLITLVNALAMMHPGVGGDHISISARNGGIMVFAPPSVHPSIDAFLAEMKKSEPKKKPDAP